MGDVVFGSENVVIASTCSALIAGTWLGRATRQEVGNRRDSSHTSNKVLWRHRRVSSTPSRTTSTDLVVSQCSLQEEYGIFKQSEWLHVQMEKVNEVRYLIWHLVKVGGDLLQCKHSLLGGYTVRRHGAAEVHVLQVTGHKSARVIP